MHDDEFWNQIALLHLYIALFSRLQQNLKAVPCTCTSQKQSSRESDYIDGYCLNVPRTVKSDAKVKGNMQASGKGNIMGMLLKKQSVLLTLMDLRVRVNVFDLEV